MKPLNPKQRCFVQEYLVDLNATQAAIRAGYSGKTAEWIGPQLLGKTHVAEAIRAEMDQRARRTGITADKVLANIERIAEAAEAEKDFSAALKGNELLGKHLKLFTDKIEHSGNITLEQLIAGA